MLIVGKFPEPAEIIKYCCANRREIVGRFAVYATDTFKEILDSLDGNERIWIEKIKAQIEEITGKILHFSWFREKKYQNKLLYYLVDENLRRVLFISFASKKDLYWVINFVLANKEELLFHLRNLWLADPSVP